MSLPADAPALVLRDIHQPPAPPWWPPAPGWWVLGAVLLLVIAGLGWLAWRRRRRRAAIARLFDDSVAAAAGPAARVAVMSELLRRAAREHDPQSTTLAGDDWLRYLDLEDDCGRLLLDGGYRAVVDADAVEALRPLARQRFLQWMGAR